MTEKTLKDLLSSLKTAGKPKTSAYDTTATVTRVENGTAWVHIPGGVTETPVKLTISAKAGDTVQVRVSGGRAFMVGNASAPPTDDTVAVGAVRQISTVRKVVEKVREVAETASRIAGNTTQYFWHTETGTDTGAHITEIPQEEFLADPENGGGNTLIRSNGVAIRDGLTELAQFISGSTRFYDGESAEPLAQFGSSGVKVGGDGKSMIEMTDDGMYATTEDGIDAFRIVSGGYSGTKTIATKTDLSNPSDDKRWRWSPATVVAPEQTPISNTTETMEATVHIRIFYNDSDIVDKYVKYSFDKTYNPSGSSTPVSKTSEQTITINSSTFIKLEFNGYVRETVKGVYVNRISVTSRPANVTKVLIFSLQLLDRITVMNPVLPSYTFGTRLGNTGAYSFTEGDEVTASGYASHAEGIQTTASGRASHAEGRGTTASGEASSISGASVIAPSHAEGYQTNATSGAAHAEGQGATASGDASHSEGYRTTASGDGAHAEGVWTEASGKASHASGYGTKASSDYQTAIGKYNVEDTNDEYALIIGNGTGNNARSNAFTVDWDGFVMAKPKAFTPTWESGQAPANSHCVVSAGLCSLFYQGTGGAHSNQTLLGTLPVGARPKSIVFCPCVKGANAYGMVQIHTDGKIYLGYISSASVTARLYFNCSFPVV